MRPTLLAVFGAVIAACVAAPGQAQTPKPDRAALAATGMLERLAERTGVYGVPPTAKTPGFIADAGWPQKLPNNWIYTAEVDTGKRLEKFVRYGEEGCSGTGRTTVGGVLR